MYLLVAATELEMRLLNGIPGGPPNGKLLVSGVGLVESTLALSSHLGSDRTRYSGVINFGVAGAYLHSGAELLDICLARKEILGDLGICYDDGPRPFGNSLITARSGFDLDSGLLARAKRILELNNIAFKEGVFVTVNCASGFDKRGDYLRDYHRALCENMEGAAIARVSLEYSIPCLEIRCVSNMVENRDIRKWRLAEASRKCAETIMLVLTELNQGEG